MSENEFFKMNFDRPFRRSPFRQNIKELPVPKYWFSCDRFTVQVNTDPQGNIIIPVAPIIKTFLGQPLENLINWAESRGWKVTVERLGSEK